MTIPNPVILRKAIAIKTELEQLDRQLEKLMAKASSQAPAKSSKATQEPLPTSSDQSHHDVQKENEEETVAGESTAHHDVVGVLSFSKPHEETLLLIEDDGQEQLSLAPQQEEAAPSDSEFSLNQSSPLPHGCDQPSHEG
jgi:hypothetical protein